MRRTYLAGERTELAWWRTGLTSLAVAIGVGRVVPELQDSGRSWPYVVLGIGFALYGLALFIRGTMRGRAEAAALGEPHPSGMTDLALAAAGPILGIAVIVLLIFD